MGRARLRPCPCRESSRCREVRHKEVFRDHITGIDIDGETNLVHEGLPSPTVGGDVRDGS